MDNIAAQLNEGDRRALEQAVNSEAQKAQLQSSTISSSFSYSYVMFSSPSPLTLSLLYLFICLVIHHLSNVCFKKCITGKISAGTLDKSEETCAQNCVERYMDSNIAVFQHLQTMRGSQ
jgi:hypothetical protein